MNLLDKYIPDPQTQKAEMQTALRQHAINEFWDRGCLRYKCYPGGQTQLYDRVHEQPKLFPNRAKPLIALCHRRFGKSHMSGVLCIERCLSAPGMEVHFGTDTKQHARQIIEGKLDETCKDMPGFISYHTRGYNTWFRNDHWPSGEESLLVIEGLDFKDGGGLRGGAADLFVIDEAREVRQLKLVMERVVTPMFKGRKNPTLLLCSTPPDSMDHDFAAYVDAADTSEPKSLITIRGSENPDWTDADTELMLEAYNDKTNIGWRREIECEMIPDTSRVIIPEWEIVAHNIIIEPADKPAYYIPYVAMDTGWVDHSAAVFGFYDFNRNKIVMIDEIFCNYTATEDFAEMVYEKIRKNFSPQSIEDLRILGDGNALNLADLNKAIQKLGDFFIVAADKYDRDASINNLRSGVQAGNVLFQKNCTQLIHQMQNGSWNKQRTKFDRTKVMGHCDLVACMQYLYKHIRWGENIRPHGQATWRSDVFQNPYSAAYKAQETEKAASIGEIFGKRRFVSKRRKW